MLKMRWNLDFVSFIHVQSSVKKGEERRQQWNFRRLYSKHEAQLILHYSGTYERCSQLFSCCRLCLINENSFSLVSFHTHLSFSFRLSVLCVSACVPKGNWKIQKIFFFACLQSRCVGVEVIKFFSSFQLEFETSLKDNFCEDSQDFPSGGRSKRKSWIPNTPERQLISARFSSVVSREEKNW